MSREQFWKVAAFATAIIAGLLIGLTYKGGL